VKKVRWILLAALITVVAAGASAFVAYGQGKEAGITEGLATRNNFLQQRSSATGGAAAAQGSAGQGQGTAAGQGQARGSAAGNFTTGQVKSVNGSEIEVTTQTESVKVKLTAQTQITKSVSGAASDIQPGERIVVQGSKGTDGAVEARSIQLGQLGALFSGAPGQGGQ
jgi:hypothetical protein